MAKGIKIWTTDIKNCYVWTTPVKEVYVWTTKVRPSIKPITTSWIYHNATLWLISLSANGVSRTTIADKNLWATTVYNNWDTLSNSNCWNLYQWGNNYWFSRSGTPSTSSTVVNASSYWPWNYYSSSTFITWNRAWDNPANQNLRWDETDTNIARRWPCDEWFHIPTRWELDDFFTIWTNLWLRWTSSPSWLLTYAKMPIWWYRYSINANLETSLWAYWSSSPLISPYVKWNSFYMFISSSSANVWSSYYQPRCNWFSIRPFTNSPIQPREWWEWVKLNS